MLLFTTNSRPIVFSPDSSTTKIFRNGSTHIHVYMWNLSVMLVIELFQPSNKKFSCYREMTSLFKCISLGFFFIKYKFRESCTRCTCTFVQLQTLLKQFQTLKTAHKNAFSRVKRFRIVRRDVRNLDLRKISCSETIPFRRSHISPRQSYERKTRFSLRVEESTVYSDKF